MKRLQKKTIRDLFQDKYRMTMTLLAIIIGTTIFGMILFSYVIVNREIDTVFEATYPSSANLTISKVDEELIELTESYADITEFEVKGQYPLRMQAAEGEWKTLTLMVYEDYTAQKLNRIFSIEGSFVPQKGEILIERDALGVGNTGMNQAITIELLDGSIKNLEVTGIVNDLTVHPASMHNVVYGYVSVETLKEWGLPLNRIDIKTAGDPYNRESILNITNAYIKELEAKGYSVNSIDISQTPGESIHKGEYAGILFILQVCSVILFIFGCTIMSSLLSTILQGQVKQIGVLKSIGACTQNIRGSYLFASALIVVINFMISMPLAILGGGKLAALFMRLGNMDILSAAVPMPIYIGFAATILLMPMIVVCFPINKGIRITVKEALNNYGTTQKVKPAVNRFFDLGVIKKLSRPVIMSLKNAVSRKGRFITNLATLTFGGSMFVAIIICMFAIKGELNKSFSAVKYDYEAITNQYVTSKTVNEVAGNIEGVEICEDWSVCSGKLQYADGRLGNQYTLYGVPDDTVSYEPQVMEGRWLESQDTNEIVMNYKFYISEPAYKVGDMINLEIGGEIQSFKIVGTVKEIGGSPCYVNKQGLDTLIPQEARQNSIRMQTTAAELAEDSATEKYNEIEAKLREGNIKLFQTETKIDKYDILNSHYMNTLISFLVGATMLVIVSAIGLASTMSIQVAERRKEIGIMKAMGATKKQIRRIVTAESTFIASTSWIISIGTGIPVTLIGAYFLGKVTIKLPILPGANYFILPYFIWLAVTLFVGYSASKKSAKRASEYSIKEALSFE